MRDLRSMTLPEMEDVFVNEYNEKRFRAAQVYEWINKKHVTSFGEMTNVSAGLRSRLALDFHISSSRIKEKHISSDGFTTKYLFELEKDTIIECVAMKYSYGRSVCVSMQAGCRMGCVFCASTVFAGGGLSRDLTAGEISAQVYEIQKDIGERVSRVVVMGGGEPFDNYENLIRFLKIIISERGLNLGARHITVSTCGLADKIREFADEGTQVNLAVSLHAPDDGLRKTLLPIARKYELNELLSACVYYSEKTGRRVTYEYALIDGINDSADNAKTLGALLKGTLSHVNLIPLNEIPEGIYRASGKKTVEAFALSLTKQGIETTVRRGLGGDVNGACGQLRFNHILQGSDA
ncbi:MAG: 23S rRNA (adenine(2503)-C(2))-methyltransferase RlmN [Defluviitaleaceae bacterium]|nr:23S rRNA (adenine(2503)-C(2))-methyltransferase RlmN [Defluviitaleaceae bacterium]